MPVEPKSNTCQFSLYELRHKVERQKSCSRAIGYIPHSILHLHHMYISRHEPLTQRHKNIARHPPKYLCGVDDLPSYSNTALCVAR